MRTFADAADAVEDEASLTLTTEQSYQVDTAVACTRSVRTLTLIDICTRGERDHKILQEETSTFLSKRMHSKG